MLCSPRNSRRQKTTRFVRRDEPNLFAQMLIFMIMIIFMLTLREPSCGKGREGKGKRKKDSPFCLLVLSYLSAWCGRSSRSILTKATSNLLSVSHSTHHLGVLQLLGLLRDPLPRLLQEPAQLVELLLERIRLRLELSDRLNGLVPLPLCGRKPGPVWFT